MHTLVINGDSGWKFKSLVRRHALDLYPLSSNVEFWSAGETEENSDNGKNLLKFWGRWPRGFDDSPTAMAHELADNIPLITGDEAKGLSIICIISRADAEKLASGRGQMSNSGNTVVRALEDFLGKLYAGKFGNGKHQFINKYWLLFVVRDAGRKPTDEDLGDGLLEAIAADNQNHYGARNVIFLSLGEQDDTRPEAQRRHFLALRFLIDMVRPVGGAVLGGPVAKFIAKKSGRTPGPKLYRLEVESEEDINTRSELLRSALKAWRPTDQDLQSKTHNEGVSVLLSEQKKRIENPLTSVEFEMIIAGIGDDNSQTGSTNTVPKEAPGAYEFHSEIKKWKFGNWFFNESIIGLHDEYKDKFLDALSHLHSTREHRVEVLIQEFRKKESDNRKRLLNTCEKIVVQPTPQGEKDAIVEIAAFKELQNERAASASMERGELALKSHADSHGIGHENGSNSKYPFDQLSQYVDFEEDIALMTKAARQLPRMKPFVMTFFLILGLFVGILLSQGSGKLLGSPELSMLMFGIPVVVVGAGVGSLCFQRRRYGNASRRARNSAENLHARIVKVAEHAYNSIVHSSLAGDAGIIVRKIEERAKRSAIKSFKIQFDNAFPEGAATDNLSDDAEVNRVFRHISDIDSSSGSVANERVRNILSRAPLAHSSEDEFAGEIVVRFENTTEEIVMPSNTAEMAVVKMVPLRNTG